MQVKFNDPDEFLEELRKETGHIDRGIVRITQLTRGTSTPSLYHIHVLATCVIADQIVKLDKDCGQVFHVDQGPADEVSARVLKRAREIDEYLDRKLKELGVDVRTGLVEN